MDERTRIDRSVATRALIRLVVFGAVGSSRDTRRHGKSGKESWRRKGIEKSSRKSERERERVQTSEKG